MSLPKSGSHFPLNSAKQRFALDRGPYELLLDKYLSFVLTLDGSSDWQVVRLEDETRWVCPDGIYEVYVLEVYAATGVLLLDPDGAAGSLCDAMVPNCWYPVVYFNGTFVTGWVGSGAAAPYRYDADTYTGSETRFTLPRGWLLSSGEVLSMSGGAGHPAHEYWYVRFRRVG